MAARSSCASAGPASSRARAWASARTTRSSPRGRARWSSSTAGADASSRSSPPARKQPAPRMADQVEIGSVFAGHRIEAVAGRGGMGVVYVATHLALNRRVALKLIAPELGADESFRERFKQESMTAASIDHPNVIPIYHAGEEDGKLYITMRYVEGTDLREQIASKGRIEPRDAA